MTKNNKWNYMFNQHPDKYGVIIDCKVNAIVDIAVEHINYNGLMMKFGCFTDDQPSWLQSEMVRPVF